jgi:hypothetical protein
MESTAAVKMGVVIKEGFKHLVLVVCGSLGLFDDLWLPPVVKPKGQEGGRQNRSSFPSALSGVCHYINRKEAGDRGRFIRALCEAYTNLCQANNKRQETYKSLTDKQMKKTSLTSSHLESTQQDTEWEVDALDKFGVLMWFTETSADNFKWVELGSAEFDTRLHHLTCLNPRWTRELVNTMLGDLRFKEPPSVGYASSSTAGAGWNSEWRVPDLSTPEHAGAASNAPAEVAAAAAATTADALRALRALAPSPDLKPPLDLTRMPAGPGSQNLTIAEQQRLADQQRQLQRQKQQLQRQQQQQQAAADGEDEDESDGDAETLAAQGGKKRSKPETSEKASKKAKTGASKALSFQPEQEQQGKKAKKA